MAELNIGQHCSFPSCHDLDFLPFTCTFCLQVFCRLHKETSAHHCKDEVSKSNVIEDVQLAAKPITYECSIEGCSKTELVPIICSLCPKQFCLKHRLPQDHNCPSIKVKAERPVAEKTKYQPNPFKLKTFKTKKAEKMAAKVAVMKLKMNARGHKGVPATERVYFNVFVKSIDSENVVPLFVSSRWTVGKSLDVAADEAKVSNFNHVGDKAQYRLDLVHATSGETLQCDKTIESLMKDDILYNGSSLILAMITPS